MVEQRYLKTVEVRRRYGNIDRSTLWRWETEEGFPPAVKILGLKLWDIADLDAWDAMRRGMAGLGARPVTEPDKAASTEAA